MNIADPRIRERIISPDDTILTAFKQMDSIYQKLLVILKDEYFVGLVSAGDIQRAIIRNTPLTAKVSEIIRTNPRLADVSTDMETIKNQMLEFRMEFMPVVDKDKRLAGIYFWEDFFGNKKKITRDPLKAKVVIMAGGVGSRLKPITNVIPKPLIPIGEKSILEMIMDNFTRIGSSEFILSVNYKSDMIHYYFSQLSNSCYSIEYIHEDKPLGTAGSLKLLKGKISETFFVTNCDTLIDQDYRDVWKYHKENENELTLVSSLKSIDIPYGTITVGEQGQLLGISEKPTLNYFINAGLYIVEPHLLDEIPDTFYNITDLIEKIRNRKGKVGVFPVSEGSLVDIGTWDEYMKYIRK